jgi:hypothetical protein
MCAMDHVEQVSELDRISQIPGVLYVVIGSYERHSIYLTFPATELPHLFQQCVEKIQLSEFNLDPSTSDMREWIRTLISLGEGLKVQLRNLDGAEPGEPEAVQAKVALWYALNGKFLAPGLLSSLCDALDQKGEAFLFLMFPDEDMPQFRILGWDHLGEHYQKVFEGVRHRVLH